MNKAERMELSWKARKMTVLWEISLPYLIRLSSANRKQAFCAISELYQKINVCQVLCKKAETYNVLLKVDN